MGIKCSLIDIKYEKHLRLSRKGYTQKQTTTFMLPTVNTYIDILH